MVAVVSDNAINNIPMLILILANSVKLNELKALPPIHTGIKPVLWTAVDSLNSAQKKT